MKFKKKASEDDMYCIAIMNLIFSWVLGFALTMLTGNPIFIVILFIYAAFLTILQWSIDGLKNIYLEDEK